MKEQEIVTILLEDLKQNYNRGYDCPLATAARRHFKVPLARVSGTTEDLVSGSIMKDVAKIWLYTDYGTIVYKYDEDKWNQKICEKIQWHMDDRFHGYDVTLTRIPEEIP